MGERTKEAQPDARPPANGSRGLSVPVGRDQDKNFSLGLAAGIAAVDY